MTNLHKFEKAGLGKAPFRCVGMWKMPSPSLAGINPEAYNRGMADRPHDLSVGSCAYCGMGILYNFIICSANERRFVVGSECVNKTGDAGLISMVKQERKRAAQELKQRRRDTRMAELRAIWEAERLERVAQFSALNAALIATARDLDLLDCKGEFVSDVLDGGMSGRRISDKALAMVREAVASAKFRHDNPSNHVGTVGKRETFEVTVARVRYFDSAFGTVWIVTMYDARGNAIVSKSASFHRERGTKLVIKATVKEHNEFRCEKQTIVQRIKEVK